MRAGRASADHETSSERSKRSGDSRRIRSVRALMYLCLTTLAALAAGCSGFRGESDAAQTPFKPVADVDQLMDGVIQPAADVYWESVATIVSKAGIEERFPRTDDEWEAVWAGAMTITESGNLLMMAPRAKDNDEWIRLSTALVDVGQLAVKAAESKRPEEVLAMGEKVYAVCTECHMKYIVE